MMTIAQKEKWFVLYTASRAEKAVAKRLEKAGATVFLPLHKEKRKWSDRVKIVEEPLFRSYIFIHCTEARLSSYATTEGVVKTVYFCGKPAAVRDSEINEIRKFLELTHEHTIISEGDIVKILCGPFDKRTGKVTRIDRKFIYLCIESLDKLTICAELKINKALVSK